MFHRFATPSLLLLALALASPTPAAVLDPAWSESLWSVTGVSTVTGMAWAPDGTGRLFLISKFGQIRIVKSGSPPTVVATPFATVSPLFTASECGLIGIAFDPDFVLNKYVYVFATVSSAEQQIIRYTADGDLGIDKTVIFAELPTKGANHDGGGIGFGWDGKLYWSIGDLGDRTGVDGDLTLLASKVARANLDGTVPPDNPFADGANGANRFTFARGFRNPFTLTFQPTTGKLWVNVAGNNYEQIFAVGNGDHAGWDDYENNQPAGSIPPSIKYVTNVVQVRNLHPVGGASRSAGVATFTTTVDHLFRNGEKLTIAGVGDATFNGAFFVAATPTATTFMVVQAGPDASSGGGSASTQNQGGAVTGGAFYDATGAAAEYRGNFFYGDFNSGRIMRAVVGPGTAVTSVDYFATGNAGATDVSVGPDGALYWVGTPGTVTRAAYIPSQQDIIVSNLHLFTTEARMVAFTVRLATAPAGNVIVSVARASGTGSQEIKAGGLLTFTPSDFLVPQVVVIRSVEDADILDDLATFTVSSIGLAPQTVEVKVIDTTGRSSGPAPGSVGDGNMVPGVPLSAQRNSSDPTLVDLQWGASCGETATEYSVHEGTLGDWYSHGATLCTTSGMTFATLAPSAGNRYFLIVPLDANREGSYGKDSLAVERPRSARLCRVQRDYADCP